MIKKIVIVFIFCSLLISCGKKGDPEYKVIKNSTFINKI